VTLKGASLFFTFDPNTLISIIIPTYNRKELLDLCLKSISKQEHKNIEIIVIDNNSADGTKALIRTGYPDIKLIENDRNEGASHARNQGILLSRGNYILSLDSDTELIRKDTLSNMIEIAENDKTIGSLGGEAIINENEFLGACGHALTKWDQNIVYVAKKDKEKLKECDFLASANCFFKKELAFKVKGFDPYYRYMYEDREFGMKIKALGYKNMVGVDIAVYHKYGKTVGLNREYALLRGGIRYAIKNRRLVDALTKTVILESIDWIKILFNYTGLPKLLKKILKVKSRHNYDATGFLYKSLRSRKEKRRYLILHYPYLLGAMLWNMIHLPETLKARKIDFLNEDELKKNRI
jgi:GT2 family glycosyltransferase